MDPNAYIHHSARMLVPIALDRDYGTRLLPIGAIVELEELTATDAGYTLRGRILSTRDWFTLEGFTGAELTEVHPFPSCG